MLMEKVPLRPSFSSLVSIGFYCTEQHVLKFLPVAILDAGRNALSFFMLLVVSLGLSVVRENLGKMMIRCQVLAGAHFVFGGVSIHDA